MDDTRDGKQGKADEGAREHPSIRLAPIDHNEYDALADLFLGDGGFAPEPAENEEPEHATHTPVLHLTHALEEDEAPVATPPEPAGLDVIESLEATDQHATALMAELLEDNQDAARDEDHGAEGVEFVRLPRSKVEVIVLGHLPVRATLWARQYACGRAKSNDEVVALVRAASGSTAIDLITGREPERAPGCADMDAAMRAIHDRADRVIMRVDERIEPELLDRPEVETITILTGADEAAVVASYRLVKTVDATLNDRYEDPADAPLVRIAVMGSPKDQAEEARYKLENAVASFLERPVDIVIGSGRIDATGTTNVFRDTRSHHAGDIIDGLVALAHEAEFGDETGTQGKQDPAVVESRPLDASSIRPKPVPSPPAPVPASKPAPAADQRDPDIRDGLCAMIDGIRPIETRCPKTPGVEMGMDEQGRLHLIACDADCRAALERLYTAQNWAREHLGLLLRAEPGLNFPSADPREETDAVMHLISHEPAALRGIYDTPVRMYALARVRLGGVIAQVATPLN
ncbi:MAG: hypothetical protein ACX94C_10790 [Phycisphaerales bacterium]